MKYLTEDLTRNFYDWERRGRGYLQWPRPVRLEPPYRPFLGHFVMPVSAPRDDGRQPTLLSRLTDWFAGRSDSSPPAATSPTLRIPDEPEPELADVPGQ